jgi:YesN/AraC family two-component response regulator
MLIPDMTLTETASMVHLNPSYFSKLFKQQTQVNFTDYLTKVRMKEASGLLGKTSLRISEVAERLGYADLAYFSNTFKKTMGSTPSDYRKGKE